MPRFVPRERKRKRLSRDLSDPAAKSRHDGTSDSNMAEIVPASHTTERETRRAALKEQILAQQPESKISGQKKKRLDKYITTKLKKEENQELLRKLGEQRVDTSLLRSSKTLGRVSESRREKARRTLRERDVLGDDEEVEEVLCEPRYQMGGDGRESGTGSEDEDGSVDADEQEKLSQVSRPSNGLVLAAFGSGLKRPLEIDGDGQPLMKKRKRRGRRHLQLHEQSQYKPPHTEVHSLGDGSGEEEWHGFSSEEDEGSGSEGSASLDSLGSGNMDDSDSTDSETSTDMPPTSETDMPARKSAFKAWASSNMNTALDFTPSADQKPNLTTSNEKSGDAEKQAEIKASFRPRAPSPDGLEPSSPNSATIMPPTKPTPAIIIRRPPEVETSRLDLPVVQEEQKIIENIGQNPITIICGATGSGKTTQIPQMLYENGYGSIGITQPRRVAATSVAERVAYELGHEHGARVAHQIRFDTNVSRGTAIKFMTDGILLREIQNDFILSKYEVVVVDEAHERSINTDLLIGLLSRIVPLRNDLAREQPDKYTPLRLVIMSATLRVGDFVKNERLFDTSPPPVLEIEGRQYTVTEHFSRRTRRDYVSEMVEKVARGHRKLPPGGMLVFLTGQQEIAAVEQKLRARLRGNGDGRVSDCDERDLPRNEYLDDEAEDEDDSDADIQTMSEDEFAIHDDNSATHHPNHKQEGTLKPHILHLYANLPVSQQRKVFQPPPSGHRLIVLATNVAETSLTIPGIRYVFDCGRSKEKNYNDQTGVESFEVGWVSKANAEQRKGRAGRMGPGGHVWRLYSSAVYERDFAEFSEPEILRTGVESVVLRLKDMEVKGLDDIVRNFPFPTAPDGQQLVKAETLLKNLGAIGTGGRITDIGKEMMSYPVGARLAKMLVLARREGVVAYTYTIAIVVGLAVDNLFIPETQSDAAAAAHNDHERNGEAEIENSHRQEYGRAQARLASQSDTSDAVKLLTAVSTHAISQNESSDNGRQFCKEHWLREKGMVEVQLLRAQLGAMVSAPTANDASTANGAADLTILSKKPKREDLEKVQRIVAAGFVDQVAIRADLLQGEVSGFGRKPKRATEVPYRTLIPTTSPAIEYNASLEEREVKRSVFIHPSSVLARLSVREMPEYIVYHHLSQANPTTVGGEGEGGVKKTRMHPLTAINARELAVVLEGTGLFEVGKPIGKIEQMTSRRRQCWVEVSMKGASGEMGWPLGAWNVVQKKEGDGRWCIERIVKR